MDPICSYVLDKVAGKWPYKNRENALDLLLFMEPEASSLIIINISIIYCN
jgi:hypothetical protein